MSVFSSTVAVFYFALKRNNRATRVEYHELSKALTGPDRQLIRTYYYNSAYDQILSPEQRKAQQPFLDSLAKTPYLEMRLGRIIPASDGGFKEKGTSVLLAGELIYYAARDFYDTAIVVTEDQDYSHAINKAKEMRKHVEVCFFKDIQPRELTREADTVIYLDKVLEIYSSKIFPEVEEENIGNQMDDQPVTPKKVAKGKLTNRLKKLVS